MELGGNAPCIVEDLVPDLDGTVARLVHGGFYQSGQSCIHMQRLYVKHDHYHKVTFLALMFNAHEALFAKMNVLRETGICDTSR